MWPLISFFSTKTEKCTLYVYFLMSKNVFCIKITYGYLNFQNEKSFENFHFFLLSGVVDENLMPIGEYSSTVKNRRKCVTVYCRVVVKGSL
jgi:hypothetical protein